VHWKDLKLWRKAPELVVRVYLVLARFPKAETRRIVQFPLLGERGRVNNVDLRKNLMLFEYRISNKKPQNYEGVTSTFDIPCSTFCGSRKFA
jgi:hypothetical protein